MTKAVLNLDFSDDKTRKKAMKIVSDVSGVNSIAMDMKDKKKMTLTGDMDPVNVVKKLRKLCNANIISFEPEKEEPKKAAEEKIKEVVVAVENPQSRNLYNIPPYYQSPYPYNASQYSYNVPPYFVRSAVEEDPNACVIC